jgi:hypothetical protein
MMLNGSGNCYSGQSVGNDLIHSRCSSISNACAKVRRPGYFYRAAYKPVTLRVTIGSCGLLP